MPERLSQNLEPHRPDLRAIVGIVEPGSRVLDLGCGNGILLKYLRHAKNVRGFGVERDQNQIIECIANGVPVVQRDLNEGLPGFPDHSYDMVILSRTLQAVQRPDILLDEMLRVGRRVVISFLNFGSIGVRLQLLSSGEMPQTRTLPDSWYETPNIHHGTIRDFRRLCREKNVAILREIPLGVNAWLARMLPNLFAQTCVFVLGREGPKA